MYSDDIGDGFHLLKLLSISLFAFRKRTSFVSDIGGAQRYGIYTGNMTVNGLQVVCLTL